MVANTLSQAGPSSQKTDFQGWEGRHHKDLHICAVGLAQCRNIPVSLSLILSELVSSVSQELFGDCYHPEPSEWPQFPP